MGRLECSTSHYLVLTCFEGALTEPGSEAVGAVCRPVHSYWWYWRAGERLFNKVEGFQTVEDNQVRFARSSTDQTQRSNICPTSHGILI